MAAVLSTVVAIPLKVFGTLQWFFTPKTFVRSRGRQTIGTVSSVDKVHIPRTSSTRGGTEYSVQYTFEIDSFRQWGSETEVVGTGQSSPVTNLAPGSHILVYYVADSHPPMSTAERRMRALDAGEVDKMTAPARSLGRRGRTAIGKVLAISSSGREGHFVHIVDYQFVDERGETWRGTRWMSEPPASRSVKVRYLPNRPEINTIEMEA